MVSSLIRSWRRYVKGAICDVAGGMISNHAIVMDLEQKRYTEKEARDLVRILLDAIAYCHDAQVVHRDLKVSDKPWQWKEDSTLVGG